MKKLAIIVPTQLDEAGALSIGYFRELRQMCEQLAGEYAISLILRVGGEKECPGLSDLSVSLIYDREAPVERGNEPAERTRSRFQNQYQRWAERSNEFSKSTDLVYDCLLAWDGCSPWCLATALECVRARRRILWLQDDPSLYLLSSDHVFYMNLCRRFDARIASEERVQREFLSLVERESSSIISLARPIDAAWYWAQSDGAFEPVFQKEERNLLTFSHMNKESELERLPGWLDAHWESLPTVHIYLIGSGPREAHYIQQIALYDVDAQFTLLGEIENVYPLLRACDGLIFSEKEKNPEIEIAAEIFGIPRIRFSESEMDLSVVSGTVKKQCKTEMNESVWQDREKFIQTLEGEMPPEVMSEEETIR